MRVAGLEQREHRHSIIWDSIVQNCLVREQGGEEQEKPGEIKQIWL